MDLEQITNIAPSELRKEMLRSSQRDIIRQLKLMANTICRDVIPTEYINKSFNKFKQGFVYYDDFGRTVGFCLWTIKTIDRSKQAKENIQVMHVHLICGKKMNFYIGNRIFPDLERYCAENNIDAIQLEPANDSLKTYYESYGFELTDTYQTIMTKRVSYKLTAYNRSKTRKHKRNTIITNEAYTFD
jgi:hypothetical protein